MNKKEEIRYLKQQLIQYKSAAMLATEALDPYRKQAEDRGIKMQLMYDHIQMCINTQDTDYPEEFDEWFDNDGVPK